MPDGICTEILKLLSDTDMFLDLLVRLFNQIYDTGKITNKWLLSAFLVISKKLKSRTCEEYRLISIINHIATIFLKIIHLCIYRKCETGITETQFGFQDARSNILAASSHSEVQGCESQRTYLLERLIKLDIKN